MNAGELSDPFVHSSVRPVAPAEPPPRFHHLSRSLMPASWTTKRRAYRDLRRQKCESFWQKKVESERSTRHCLWQPIDVLVACGHAPPSTTISAQGLHHFFDEKSAGVRKSIADAPPPCFVLVTPDCDSSSFCTLSIDLMTSSTPSASFLLSENTWQRLQGGWRTETTC